MSGRYWDLSERERSQLSEEEVQGMLAIQLMESGCPQPREPELLEVPKVEFEPKDYYAVVNGYSSIAVFEKIEDAEAFLKLPLLEESYDYAAGSDYSFAKRMDPKIVNKKLYTHQHVLDAKGLLERVELAKRHNKSEQDRYSVESKAAQDAVSGVWSDWQECRVKESESYAVRRTYEEYKDLCDGDADKAFVFLVKAKGADEVVEAFEWLGIVVPDHLLPL